MTEDELAAIEARALALWNSLGGCWDCDTTAVEEFLEQGVPALVAEVRRLRGFARYRRQTIESDGALRVQYADSRGGPWEDAP